MIVDRAKVLDLVNQKTITPALKTYTDSVLFYYLGYLSASKHLGEISEIGLGGSTSILLELSELCKKTLIAIDCDKQILNHYADMKHWPESEIVTIHDLSSNLLTYKNIPNFSYCHVDGNKDYKITLSDLEFYLNKLELNGLICQDDYGNNKWPTVTDAVKELEYQGKLKIILVGDSSVWVTRPEYYDYWMQLLVNDYEFSLLSSLCQVINSVRLNKIPAYFFLQSLSSDALLENYSASEQEYFNNILNLDAPDVYLQAPYKSQSTMGIALKYNTFGGYYLTEIYDNLRGPDWPIETPTTLNEINNLPDWVKDEIQLTHNIKIDQRIVKNRVSDRASIRDSINIFKGNTCHDSC